MTFTKAVHSAGIRTRVKSDRTASMSGNNRADICIYKTMTWIVVGSIVVLNVTNAVLQT